MLGAMGKLPIVLVILAVHFIITLAQQEVILSIDDPDKTQYHEANFNTSSYEFGYEVGPNGQFHHETRGPDGVTYGCYGYIDPNGKLRVTHYVADSHGFRVVEPNYPVEIFGDAPTQNSNAITEDEPSTKKRGKLVPWRDLYLPRGCGMYPGGLRPEGPPVRPHPTTGGFTVGTDISQAGVSGMITTSHNTSSHTGSTSIGGTVATTGIEASTSHNSTGEAFGVTYNHTLVSSGSLTGQGVQGTNTGSINVNSTHVSAVSETNVTGSIQGSQVAVEGMLNHTEVVTTGSTNVSSTSGGSFGGTATTGSISAGVSGMHTTNVSINAPTSGPQQGSVTVGGGGSVDNGRPPQETSTESPYGPRPTQAPPPMYTTLPPQTYPTTASGVQPPMRPIDTGSPPSSGNNNQYPSYPNYAVAISQYPYFFVPYPYPPPNVPQAPCNCPQDQNRPNLPAGYLGFIPVIYVPNCNLQKSDLPTHINFPVAPPPTGTGRALDEQPFPLQQLVQNEDGSWVLQQPPVRQNRTRRLRNRRLPLMKKHTVDRTDV